MPGCPGIGRPLLDLFTIGLYASRALSQTDANAQTRWEFTYWHRLGRDAFIPPASRSSGPALCRRLVNHALTIQSRFSGTAVIPLFSITFAVLAPAKIHSRPTGRNLKIPRATR